jgi:hypothetical protein
MSKWALVLLGVLTASAAAAGESRTSFHVGLIIIGTANASTDTPTKSTSVPMLPQAIARQAPLRRILPSMSAKSIGSDSAQPRR